MACCNPGLAIVFFLCIDGRVAAPEACPVRRGSGVDIGKNVGLWGGHVGSHHSACAQVSALLLILLPANARPGGPQVIAHEL